jgi:hypothetical protein
LRGKPLVACEFTVLSDNTVASTPIRHLVDQARLWLAHSVARKAREGALKETFLQVPLVAREVAYLISVKTRAEVGRVGVINGSNLRTLVGDTFSWFDSDLVNLLLVASQCPLGRVAVGAVEGAILVHHARARLVAHIFN